MNFPKAGKGNKQAPFPISWKRFARTTSSPFTLVGEERFKKVALQFDFGGGESALHL
jgi:hypothetical protein